MKWKWASWKWRPWKFASERFAGAGVPVPNTQVADAKTSPLITRGFGCHPRFLVLGGWTAGTIGRAFLSVDERRRWAVAGEDEGDPHG